MIIHLSKYWYLLLIQLFGEIHLAATCWHTCSEPCISTSLTCTFWTLHGLWSDVGCFCLVRGLHGTQCFAPHIPLCTFPKGPTSAIVKQMVGFISSCPEVSSVEADFSFQKEMARTIPDIQYYLKCLLISSDKYGAGPIERYVLKQGEIIW